jgi:hypothetical protein
MYFDIVTNIIILKLNLNKTGKKHEDKTKSSALPVSELALKLRPKFFPIKLGGGFTCEPVGSEEMNAFMSKNFVRVFGRNLSNTVKAKKNSPEWRGFQSTYKEYEKIHSEYFLFKKNGKTIGWSCGEIDDFETFYMRNTGLLPAYRNSKIYGKYLTQMLRYIKALGINAFPVSTKAITTLFLRLKCPKGLSWRVRKIMSAGETW